MNEHQQLTKYIKHLADSANFKAVTFNTNCSGLTGLLSEMPNVSYTWPLCLIEKKQKLRMKLFEFLDIISKEKFPFRLEYEDWSGNVKVIVDTFTGIEEYCFDENGVTELTEFQEIKSSENISEIEFKIGDLINRPEKAWIDASKDLGIRFIHPYKFTGLNNEEYEVTGLLPDFGNGKGVLITDRKSDEEAVIIADLTNDYLMTGLSPRYYDKYDRESFIETLSEWGWIGDDSKKPDWIENN